MQTVFNRYEKKYMLLPDQYRELRRKLKCSMQEDKYGLHTICNIYYDTANDDLIRYSIQKPEYKEKLRLRSYGIPNLNDKVFLEIKKKYKGIVNKRRVIMTLKEAYAYTIAGIRPSDCNQITKEIDYFIDCYQGLAPKVYLAYDRVALFGKEDNDFRITFDTNIRSRYHQIGLENGDTGTPLLPFEYYLMETKVMGATPIWFSHILSELEIYPVSFSKYGNVFEQHLCGSVDDKYASILQNQHINKTNIYKAI